MLWECIGFRIWPRVSKVHSIDHSLSHIPEQSWAWLLLMHYVTTLRFLLGYAQRYYSVSALANLMLRVLLTYKHTFIMPISTHITYFIKGCFTIRVHFKKLHSSPVLTVKAYFDFKVLLPKHWSGLGLPTTIKRRLESINFSKKYAHS